MVSPALAKCTQTVVSGDLWNRPGLSRRDRSMVTLAALIARNQTVEPPYHLNLAFDNGVKPAEVSEVITHLAFYSGWPNAMSAVVAPTMSSEGAESQNQRGRPKHKYRRDTPRNEMDGRAT
jgi:4-carboxymuconolactone decarboxylase